MTPPDRYAVLGNPVAHSRSPFIHTAFAQQTGQAVDYGRVLCPLDGFAQAVQRFAAEGGRGCNVTVPFKFEAPALAAHCTPRALLAGAANVLKLDGDRSQWWADNTDGIGLLRDIEQGATRPLQGLRVLLVGAGGAGAGVLGPLLSAKPAALVLANRTPAKAQQLVDRHADLARQHGVALRAAPLDDAGAAFDVLVNASASSLQGAASPVPLQVLKPGTLAIDLMYGPAAEPFLAWAHAAGAEPRDGLGMLVEQAAEAFHFWRGVRPQTAPVLAALRADLAAGA
jgi:shikimate dehydrogenase